MPSTATPRIAMRPRHGGARVAAARRRTERWLLRTDRHGLIVCSALIVATLLACGQAARLPVSDRAPAAAATARAPFIAPLALSTMLRGDLVPRERLDTLSGPTRPPSPRSGERPDLTERRWHLLLIVVSVSDRMLWLVDGRDTLARIPVGVESGQRLVHGGRAWRFRTPRGEHRVLRKITGPVWVPPDWHYAEAARDHGLRLATLPPGGVSVSAHRRLEIRDGLAGIRGEDGTFRPLPRNEHIVFDGHLFIPPVETQNRRLAGVLGRFALDLGDGYMIHGTSDQASIGQASTHGCIRVGDDDMAWLFAVVPLRARVVIR